MPLWLTETGWPSIPSGTVMGATQAQAEATQADRITDLFRVLRGNDRLVQGMIYFCFNNPYFGDQPAQSTYSATNPENWFGLWHTDGSGGVFDGSTCTAKPAAITFANEAMVGLTNSK